MHHPLSMPLLHRLYLCYNNVALIMPRKPKEYETEPTDATFYYADRGSGSRIEFIVHKDIDSDKRMIYCDICNHPFLLTKNSLATNFATHRGSNKCKSNQGRTTGRRVADELARSRLAFNTHFRVGERQFLETAAVLYCTL